jgi:hypothetical protein
MRPLGCDNDAHDGGGGENNRLDLKEIRWEGVEWIHLFEDSNQWWVCYQYDDEFIKYGYLLKR